MVQHVFGKCSFWLFEIFLVLVAVREEAVLVPEGRGSLLRILLLL